MKFLVVIVAVLVGVCLGQSPNQSQRRQSQDQYQDVEQQYQQDPNQRGQQPQYEPRQRSSESTTFIPIIRFDKEQGEDGSYKAAWETGNNIIAQEEGFLKSLGPDPDSPDGEPLNAQVQQGSYSYTSPEGQIISVTYTADETGFHAVGDHLPTPPPVSPEVQKGLDLIYAGIKAQQEAAAREPQNSQAIRNDNQIPQDYNGQYKQ